MANSTKTPARLEEIEGLDPSMDALDSDGGGGAEEDEDFGDFDQMFDPIQAFGQLFVTQNEATNSNETIADILAGIRDTLEKATKVLYKINLNLEKKK